MYTISSHVYDWIATHPFVQQHLELGIINASALARSIEPEIEYLAGEKVSIEAVTIAINRYESGGQTLSEDSLRFIKNTSVQNNVTIYHFDLDSYDCLKLDQLEHGDFFITTRGVWYASIITGSTLDALANTAKSCESGLSAITMKLDESHEPILGVSAGILSILATHGVNLEEVFSVHNEMTILIDKNYTQTALSILATAK